MSRLQPRSDCPQAGNVGLYAMHALTPGEAAKAKVHLASCVRCRRELERLRPVADALAAWPADVVRPRAALQERLARRIAVETGRDAVVPGESAWREPQWEQVAPGIECKLLATDSERDIVSMLVRLAPGGEYPPHTHAGVEELHLLQGELWIDDRKLVPGDYNRAEPGTSDARVFSQTGCTCVLITSPSDELR